MEYDKEKVAEFALAMLHLNHFTVGGVLRAWKGFDWDAMNLLHEQGYISDPKSKAKSIVFTEEGAKRAEQLFSKHFVSTD